MALLIIPLQQIISSNRCHLNGEGCKQAPPKRGGHLCCTLKYLITRLIQDIAWWMRCRKAISTTYSLSVNCSTSSCSIVVSVITIQFVNLKFYTSFYFYLLVLFRSSNYILHFLNLFHFLHWYSTLTEFKYSNTKKELLLFFST